ncbi:metallophosphoesterase [Pseudomonas viridiflava]|uniref:metallophosphoesterase n=1 Tax=Pseudomonas viridiflava TaxID=33069 RepID=UPI0018E62391|nr:metallophosphoesterase [Pseudomonas viridiflava]MBI6727463.1 metallophosphoesterase [Pseudomonas viridiflava]
MSKVLTITQNTIGTDYGVGDIHGCFSLLERSLGRIGFDPRKDRLFGVGDLTDRGPQSFRAADFLDKPWFYSLMGNHDALACITARKILDGEYHLPSKDVDNFMDNGGEWIRDRTKEELEHIVRTFSGMPMAIEYKDAQGTLLAGMLHAELDDDLDWNELTAILRDLPQDYVYSLDVRAPRGIHVAMWGRAKCMSYKLQHGTSDFRESWYESNGVPMIICGHNVVDQDGDGPKKISNNRLIDHGMVYNPGEYAKIYKISDILQTA